MYNYLKGTLEYAKTHEGNDYHYWAMNASGNSNMIGIRIWHVGNLAGYVPYFNAGVRAVVMINK